MAFNDPYLYFPLSDQAFDGLGDVDTLEYLTDLGFGLLAPDSNTLQWGFYHPQDVWSVSDTITIGGNTVGVVGATGASGAGFVSVIDIDSGLATPPKAGDTATNGTTSQRLTRVQPGVKVGGTGTWGTVPTGQGAWVPNGDHELLIPNALAAPWFGPADRGNRDLCMVWRQVYPSTDDTPQFLADFGARQSGGNSGGYSYRPSITAGEVRCQTSYSAVGAGTASYLIGATASRIPDITIETTCVALQSHRVVPRFEIGIVGDASQPVGAYFDTANGYGASDVDLPLAGSQHGYPAAIFGRTNSTGTAFEDALGSGLNDYKIRDLIIYFPLDYDGGQSKSLACALQRTPGATVGSILGLS